MNVPKRAIVDSLLADPANSSAVKTAYKTVRHAKGDLSRAALINLTMDELVEVYRACSATKPKDARELHNAWRYRGMKALFLYRYTGGKPQLPDLLHAMNNSLEEVAGEVLEEDPDQLAFDAIDVFEVDGREIVEIRYRYAALLNYVDPADEDAKVVGDLRNGFAWLAATESWAAINARDLDIRDRVATCLMMGTAGKAFPLRLSKGIVDQLEKAKTRRRVALIDPKTRTTRRYTGRQLGDDQTAQDEIAQRMKSDDAPFTGFNVDVDANTSMVVGYNNGRGKLFFSKDLEAEQLRTWGPPKITAVLKTVNDALEASSTFRTKSLKTLLYGIPPRMHDAAAEIAAAVAACKQKRKAEQELSRTALEFFKSLRPQAEALVYVLDEKNEEVADLVCSSCQSELIRPNKDGTALECKACEHVLTGTRFNTSRGGSVRISDLSDAIQLLPAQDLRVAVLDAVAGVTGLPANHDEEFFHLTGNVLKYSRLTEDSVLTIDEIPELSSLIKKTVPAARQGAIDEALKSFKEKCSKMESTNCASCVTKRKGKKCYLRLFGLLDSTYTPQPHGSMEFGDYAKQVTIDGRPEQYLTVAMKKMPRYKGAVTSSKPDGREILEQTFRYMQDVGVSAVGVCTPRLLHDNLKKLLILLAKWHHKKIVFIDDQTLASMISTIMTKRRMKLDDF